MKLVFVRRVSSALMAVALSLQCVFPFGVSAQSLSASGMDIESLNKQIAAKEVELLKLNSDFRTHYTARDRKKQRRMKFYDFAAGAVANAGDITLMSQFWKYQKKPGEGLNKRGRLEAG